MEGEALAPGEGWDRRGVRLTSVWRERRGLVALYDGRASAAENWHERTGLAAGTAARLTAVDGPVPSLVGPALRYACVVTTADGLRVFLEQSRPDGAHELRTVHVPRPAGVSQAEQDSPAPR